MPIDASIPLSVKVPDGMSAISSIANTANAMQTLRTNQLQQQRVGIQLQQEQGALDARQSIAKVMSDPDLRDPDTGLTDLNKLWPALQQADPKGYLRDEVFGKIAGVNADMMKVKSAGMQLGDQAQTFIGQRLQTLAQDPNVTKDQVNAALDDFTKLAPAAKPAADIIRKNINGLDMPGTIGPALMKFSNMAFPLAAKAPATSFSSNGQQITPVQSNPLAGPVAPNGPSIQMQIPPTAPAFDPATRTPGYVGPTPATAPSPVMPAAGRTALSDVAPPSATVPPAVQASREADRLSILRAERAREVQAPDTPDRALNLQALDKEIAKMSGARAPAAAPARVQSGPALGTEQNVAGTVDVVNKDYADTAEHARTASQDIGLLQNIKKFAKGAVTGVGSDRRAYTAGLAGLIGIGGDEMEKLKTNTDLLAKNTNMLALAGGDTNLARIMAEGANPNTHMTSEAIEDAANQIIAQRKLALAKQSYMQHFKSDPELYSKELANFNQIADPRVLQLRDMSPDEKARMKASMSPSEQRDFGAKIRKMQALGLVQ